MVGEMEPTMGGGILSNSKNTLIGRMSTHGVGLKKNYTCWLGAKYSSSSERLKYTSLLPS